MDCINTFCFQHFSSIEDIEWKTLHVLLSNGFKSKQSLLMLDCDMLSTLKGYNILPFAQKLLIKEELNALKCCNDYEVAINEEVAEECDDSNAEGSEELSDDNRSISDANEFVSCVLYNTFAKLKSQIEKHEEVIDYFLNIICVLLILYITLII